MNQFNYVNYSPNLKPFIMKNFILGLLLITAFSFSNSGNAQEAMIGEVKMFAGNFAPRGWAMCNGQLLQISQNSALFSILGTTYGASGSLMSMVRTSVMGSTTTLSTIYWIWMSTVSITTSFSSMVETISSITITSWITFFSSTVTTSFIG